MKSKEKDIWVTSVCNFFLFHLRCKLLITVGFQHNLLGITLKSVGSGAFISVMPTDWKMMHENSLHEMLSQRKICGVENKSNLWIEKENFFWTADLNEIICTFWKQFGLGFCLHCTETVGASRGSCIHLTQDFCRSYNIHLMTIANSSH